MKSILLILLFIFISCDRGEKKLVEINGNTMGTYYRVKLYSDKPARAHKKDIDKFLKLFNNVFSTYIPDSEISKINKSKFNKVKMSDTMSKLMTVSLDIGRKSRGYFDVTVAPLVNLWGFGLEGERKKPSDEEISKQLQIIGTHKLRIKDNWLEKDNKNLTIDMSAIAKGFGVDELVKFLEYEGYKNLLVEIGGEVRTRGKKSDGSLWRIGIEGPNESLGSKIVKVVPLVNMAMATSGSYRNYIKYGDDVFTHTIDPKTGRPITHKTLSVSVLHDYCADADAWATALMSMGEEQALKFAEENDLLAYIQVKTEQGVKILVTKSFEKYINKHTKN